MSEVAIILSDLYLTEHGRGGADDRDSAVPKDVLPALARVARFAGVSALPGDWRAWLAGWLGRADLAAACNATPAVVAAAALDADNALPPAARSVWLATPLHLIAGISSVHLDYRGLLKLDEATREQLCREFGTEFAARDFSLRRLPAARPSAECRAGAAPRGTPDNPVAVGRRRTVSSAITCAAGAGRRRGCDLHDRLRRRSRGGRLVHAQRRASPAAGLKRP
jgi:hypothetical protein